jgi:death-on-curing protein
MARLNVNEGDTLALTDAPDCVWQAGPVRIAAAYAFSLVRDHPFLDGNKRIEFTTAILFLALNGRDVTASEAEATLKTFALAAGELGEAGYAGWLRKNARRIRGGD